MSPPEHASSKSAERQPARAAKAAAKTALPATLLALVAALALHAPSLNAGFRSDDYVQGAMLRGQFAVQRGPLDLFDFASGDPREDAQLRDAGYLPWWSTPGIRLRMARPLASALIALDHRTLGWHARGMHVHSLLWLAALLCVVSFLLFESLPPSAAAIALGFFALSSSLGVPVLWLANRSTLIASTLGFAAVTCFVRSRRAGASGRDRRVNAAAAAAFAVTALLAGEYAVPALAYALSYALCERGSRLGERLRALAPIGVPVVVYLGLRGRLHADVASSGFYLSPIHDLPGFIAAAVTRIPVLTADLLFGLRSAYFSFGSTPLRDYALTHRWFSPSTWLVLPEWAHVHVALGVLALLAFAALARFSARLHEGTTREHVSALAWGALLSMLPAAGSLPFERLLVAASLGTCALAAGALVGMRAAPSGSRSGRRLRAALALALLYVFGFGAAQRTYDGTRAYRLESEALRLWALDADLPEPARARDTRVYVVSAADFTTAANLPWLRLAHGLPLPQSYRRLSPAAAALDLHRSAERTLELTVLSNKLAGSAVPSLYRDTDHPLRTGDTTELPGLLVRVLAARAGNPYQMRFEFDRSLDDEQLYFLRSTPDGLRRMHMPAVGQTVRLARPVFRDLRLTGRPFPAASDD